MERVYDFPNRVIRYDDGAYRWTYNLRQEGNDAPQWTMVKICAAVFIPIALIMLVMIWQYGARDAVLCCLGLLAIGVGLPALIWKLAPPDPSFKMTDEYIEAWPKGRGQNIHTFQGVRRVEMEPALDRIRIKWVVSGLDVYVPREDYGLVRDFILDHVPESAEKRY